MEKGIRKVFPDAKIVKFSMAEDGSGIRILDKDGIDLPLGGAAGGLGAVF